MPTDQGLVNALGKIAGEIRNASAARRGEMQDLSHKIELLIEAINRAAARQESVSAGPPSIPRDA